MLGGENRPAIPTESLPVGMAGLLEREKKGILSAEGGIKCYGRILVWEELVQSRLVSPITANPVGVKACSPA